VGGKPCNRNRADDLGPLLAQSLANIR